MRGFLATAMLFCAFSANAQTLEERVSRLESKVEALVSVQKPRTIYYTKGISYYTASPDCSKITLDDDGYSWNFNIEIKFIKEIKCGDVTYVIGTFNVPRGFTRAGQQMLKAYNKNEVIVD